MKEQYNKIYNRIAPEKSDEELFKAIVANSEKKPSKKSFLFKKAVIIPLVATLSLFATTLTAGAVYTGIQFLQKSGITKNEAVAEKIQSNIYEDSNENVKMSVEEYISDGLIAFATVHYEALNDKGKEWLNSYEKIEHSLLSIVPKIPDWEHMVSHGYGNFEIEEFRTETDRYFRIELEASSRDYGGEKVEFNYILDNSVRTVELDTECNVDVKWYELSSDENATDLFTPEYLAISDISYTIYGMNHKVYAESRDERGLSQWSLLPKDFDHDEFLDITFISSDGSSYKPEGGFMLGAGKPMEENRYTDLKIASGGYHFFDNEKNRHGFESIRSEDISSISICGVNYVLIPIE